MVYMRTISKNCKQYKLSCTHCYPVFQAYILTAILTRQLWNLFVLYRYVLYRLRSARDMGLFHPYTKGFGSQIMECTFRECMLFRVGPSFLQGPLRPTSGTTHLDLKYLNYDHSLLSILIAPSGN